MQDLLVVVLVALATHRATVLLAEDKILDRPRLALQWRFERAVERRTGTVTDRTWQSPAAYMLSCRWCLSIWVGGVMTAAAVYTVGVPMPVMTWLAASSVTGVLKGSREDAADEEDP